MTSWDEFWSALVPDLSVIKLLVLGFIFFFSSRRRHTRSLCDWSSDVCSSDLFRRFHVAGSLPFMRTTKPLGQEHFDGFTDQLSTVIAEHAECLRVRIDNHSLLARSEERRVGKECESRMSRVSEEQKLQYC